MSRIPRKEKKQFTKWYKSLNVASISCEGLTQKECVMMLYAYWSGKVTATITPHFN